MSVLRDEMFKMNNNNKQTKQKKIQSMLRKYRRQ